MGFREYFHNTYCRFGEESQAEVRSEVPEDGNSGASAMPEEMKGLCSQLEGILQSMVRGFSTNKWALLISLLLLVANLANLQNDAKTGKIIETLAHGYSSQSAQ